MERQRQGVSDPLHDRVDLPPHLSRERGPGEPVRRDRDHGESRGHPRGRRAYVGSGLDGFAALQPGYGTVVAHDRDGKVIDYVPLHIVVPDALVVYDAAYTGDHPPSVDALSLQNGDRPSYRTVGEVASEASAGSIRVAWTAADPTTLAIESYTDGVVTLHALRHGTTTLTAVGAALTKTITVDVQ